MKFRLMMFCMIVFLVCQAVPVFANSAMHPAHHSRGNDEQAPRHVHGDGPMNKHDPELMEWVKDYPQEHKQFLGLMQERYQILADNAGKMKASVELWQAASERKDQQALDTAKELKEVRLSENRKALHHKRAELHDQWKALASQKDKLDAAQQQKAIQSILNKSAEMNELLKETGKTLDEINAVLQGK